MSPELVQQIREAALYLVALILSICVHEFGHAFVADRLGDPLPREQGRVTLNPLAHADPIGTLLMPVLGFVMSAYSPQAGAAMLGWGRPVEVSLSARSITRKISIRTADFLISSAGPAMNVVFAFVLSVVYAALLRAGGRSLHLGLTVGTIVGMNINLAFFNLIPCPPLDGGHILRALLPRSLSGITDALERYGNMILIGLLVTGALNYVMWPAAWVGNWWLERVTRWALGF